MRSSAPFDHWVARCAARPKPAWQAGLRRVWLLAGALVLSLWVAPARASLDQALSALDAKDESLPVDVRVHPALGRDAPASSGWGALAIRLHNRSSRSLSVKVHVTSVKPAENSALLNRSAVQSEHWLEANAWRSVVVPVPGAQLATALVLIEHEGEIVGRARTYHGAVDKPHVLELAAHGRLASALRAAGAATVRPHPLHGSPSLSPPSFSSAAAIHDPVSDTLLLPLQAAGYSAATLVWTTASQLERLSNPQWVALSSWLLAGGTLAVSDADSGPLLTSQRLRTLVGEALAPGPVSTLLTRGESPLSLSTQAKTAQVIEMPDIASEPLLPGEAYDALRGYLGPNLRDSPWGQVATYGLGEVHLLAFEPSNAPFSDLAWTREHIEELVSHARHRRRHVALPLGKQNPDDARSYALRSTLNPRVGQDWTLWISALLLLSLALLAGPINFNRKRKRRSPLMAIWHLHLLSAVSLLGVVTLASLTRATHQSVRRLSLSEAGAGMTHASITRFRSFYTRELSRLHLDPAHSGNVIAVVDSERETTSQLTYSARGLRVADVHSQPWKLLLVREEGTVKLPGSVTLLADDGDLLIRNQLDRDLESVVVRTAAGRVFFFDTIASGTRALASEGHAVQVVGAPARATHFPLLIHNFDWRMDERTPGLADTWRAIEALRSGEVDWWPPDVPVLLAQLDGGEGRLHDSGLHIESDRALLRVVGYGGRP